MGAKHGPWLIAIAVVTAMPAAAAAQRLEAAEGVHVASQEVKVHLGRGVARVDVALRVESTIGEAAELRLLVPRPAEAGLQSIRACAGRRCNSGIPDRTHGEEIDAYEVAIEARVGRPGSPVARVVAGHESGPVFEVHAAPVSSSAPLTLELSYVAPLATVGGRLVLAMPLARDVAAVADPLVEVTGPDGTAGGYEDDEAFWDIPAGTTLSSAWSAHCGARRCARFWVAAGYESPPRDALILVDRSPSMMDAAPGRLAHVLEGLLAELPDGSRARIVGFGRRAAELVPPTDVRAIEPSSVPIAPDLSLGAATRLDAAIPFVEELSGPDPLVVVVGDRPQVPSSAMSHALAQRGATLSTVGLEPPGWAVASQDTVTITAEQERSESVLRRTLRAAIGRSIAARVSVAGLGPQRFEAPLRAGEALSVEGELTAERLVVDGLRGPRLGTPAPTSIAAGLGVRLAEAIGHRDPRASRVTVDSRDLDANEKWRTPWLDAYPPLRTVVGPVPHRQTPPVMLGPDYAAGRLIQRTYAPRIIRCGCSSCGGIGGVSKEAVGRMMRTVEPRVRGCFAQERRGRASWSARAVYTLALSRREVVAVQVTGTNLSERLTSCLTEAVDQLVIPPSEETIVVTYPFVSEAVPSRPPVAVDPTLGRALDRLFASEPTEPLAPVATAP